MKGFSVFFALLGILAVQSPVFSARPTNCTAFFRSGQVFITWNEVVNGQAYVIYSKTSPITAGDLIESNKRFQVAQNSAYNPVMAKELTLTDNGAQFSTNFRPLVTITRNVINPIDDSQPGIGVPVPDGVGMIVLTTHVPGDYYYAVTAIVGGTEDKTVDAGNSAGPISEIVQDPTPVLFWQSDSMAARLYYQYVDIDTFNTTMANTKAYVYWVGVPLNYRRTATRLPLNVYVDGYPGIVNSGSMDSRGNWCVYFCSGIEIKTYGNGNWWFGYSQTHQFDTSKIRYGDGDPVPTTGPVVNFDQARIMNLLKWMILQEPYYSNRIDTNFISVRGGSMGGGGTLMFLQNYPDFFAYGRANVPPTNFLEMTWQWLTNCEASWGDNANDNMKVAFTGWRSEWLTENFGGMTVHEWFNLERYLLDHPGLDMPFIALCSGGMDNSVNWPQQGKNYYTNLNATKRGWLGRLNGHSGHYCDGNSNDQTMEIRKNHSYPAFSDAQSNPILPLPDAPLDMNYDFNRNFIWSTPAYRVGGYQDQIDSINRYEIVIASLVGDDVADVTPRKLQRFVSMPGEQYIVKNTAVGNTNSLYQIDTVTADSLGLVTFSDFSIKTGTSSSGGSRFVMVPLVPVTGAEKFARQLGQRRITVNPNPFNPSTRITVQGIGLDCLGDVRIYDVSGHCVAKLALHASQHRASAVWDATAFSSGIYIVKATAGSVALTKQIILIK